MQSCEERIAEVKRRIAERKKQQRLRRMRLAAVSGNNQCVRSQKHKKRTALCVRFYRTAGIFNVAHLLCIQAVPQHNDDVRTVGIRLSAGGKAQQLK